MHPSANGGSGRRCARGTSAIQGFGLYTKSSDSLDWKELKRPVALPYLGRETEVESSVQARVLRSVLCGAFDVVKREQLPTPAGSEWVQDGLYVALMETKELKKLGKERPPAVTDPNEQLLQVPIEPELSRAVSYVEEGDEQVCYLKYEETRELLHMPPHVFRLLSEHANDEHADRNMATHLVQFCRGSGVHLLVSAHPIFRHSAFIMGNANEPPRGAPSLELLELRLTPAADDDPLMVRAGLTQDPVALRHFDIFRADHPEVVDKSTFFVTRKSHFQEAEELTVVYGSSYKRTYSTWGHAGVPIKYHVPHDIWPDGTWDKWAQWPTKVPGWYNVDCQPLNRPAFERVERGGEGAEGGEGAGGGRSEWEEDASAIKSEAAPSATAGADVSGRGSRARPWARARARRRAGARARRWLVGGRQRGRGRRRRRRRVRGERHCGSLCARPALDRAGAAAGT